MASRLRTDPEMFARDARRIARHANELLEQLAAYKHNGPNDDIRFLLIASVARELLYEAARAARRSEAKREARS